jgi:hypothetical protein
VRVSRRACVDRYYLLQWRGFGLFLHHIHHSDPINVTHNHPWNFVSLIFGNYVEYRKGRSVRRWGFNFLRAGVQHRIQITKPVWTLVLHGRRSVEWTVCDEVTGEVIRREPWRGVGNIEQTSYV